ncbi:MAG: ABC transporter substrate binding protein [bacterium]
MQSKEKEDIGEALQVILVRSFTYLSLLVIIVIIIYFVRRKPFQDPVPPGARGMVAIVDGYAEYKAHIQGLREGLLFKGIHTIFYQESSLGEIKEDPVYVIGTEKVKRVLEKLPGRTIIGYAQFQEKPAANYTGVFSGFDWSESMKLYTSILPGLKTIGVLYSESIPGSREQVEALQNFARTSQGLEIKPLPIPENGRELPEKLDFLLDKIDALLGVVQDKNVEAALPVITSSCLNRRLPFIGGGKIGAQMGALAALEYDQKRLGRQVADNIIYQIIKQNKTPAQIPILLPRPDIFINLSTSYRLGIQLPKDIQAKAAEKYS